MRSFSTILSLAVITTAAVIATGCAGPSRKLGRGVANVTEPLRMGEMRRSMEQYYVAYGPDISYTAGFFHGLGKTVGRTAVGVYEIVTFPIPDQGRDGYGPVLKPDNPVYPDNYKPKIISDPTYQADANVGFGGGDVAPWFPGSRFSVFD